MENREGPAPTIYSICSVCAFKNYLRSEQRPQGNKTEEASSMDELASSSASRRRVPPARAHPWQQWAMKMTEDLVAKPSQPARNGVVPPLVLFDVH